MSQKLPSCMRTGIKLLFELKILSIILYDDAVSYIFKHHLNTIKFRRMPILPHSSELFPYRSLSSLLLNKLLAITLSTNISSPSLLQAWHSILSSSGIIRYSSKSCVIFSCPLYRGFIASFKHFAYDANDSLFSIYSPFP